MESHLQEPAEIVVRQADVAHDVAHCDRVHGIVPGDGDHARAVGHDDVLALASYPEANLLQSPDRIEVVHARQPRHGYTSTSTCLPPASRAISRTTSRYSRMASAIFASASASVSPWEWQPGRPGTETANPSSDSSIRTVYFITTSPRNR